MQRKTTLVRRISLGDLIDNIRPLKLVNIFSRDMFALVILLQFSIFIDVLFVTPNDHEGDMNNITSSAPFGSLVLNDIKPHKCSHQSTCDFAKNSNVPKCYCDDLCLLYNDCCFDYVDSHKTVPETLQTFISFSTCKPGYLDDARIGIRMIDTCPTQTKSAELIRRCLEANVLNTLSVTPVSFTPGIVFKNAYCALCHGVSNYLFWDIQVDIMSLWSLRTSCSFRHLNLDTITSLNTTDAWKFFIENECKYTFLPPAEIKPHYCYFVEKNQNYSNPLCGRYQDPVVTNRGKVYTNQECCMGVDFDCYVFSCFADTNKPGPVWKSSLNSMMIMLQFLPKPADTLHDGGGCPGVSPERESISKFINDEDEKRSSPSLQPGLCLSSTLYKNAEYYIERVVNVSVSDRMVRIVLFALDLYIKNLVHPLTLKRVHNKISRTKSIGTDLGNRECPELELIFFTLLAQDTLTKEQIMDIHRWSRSFSIYMDYTEGNYTVPDRTMSVLPIHRSPNGTECKALSSSLREYDASYVTLTKIPREFCLNLKVFDEYKPKEDVHYFRFQCTDIYTTNNKQQVEIESIITHACFSVSSICLLLAIPIHNYFTVSKSVAGKNIQHLMISVLLSNLSFMFGVGNSHDKVSCTVFGSLIHLFFLCTFSWMSVSLVYFAHIFKKMQKFPNQSPPVSLFHTCMCFLFGYGMPLLIVIPCIFLDVFEYAEFQIGYSKNEVCFPSSYPAVVVVFLAPISVSILVNIVCLNFTIRIICHESQLSMTGIGIYKAYLPVYLKLNVISGLSWVFGVLAEVTEYIVFHYIFIITSGLLGAFVAILFVFYTRELRLCLQRLRGEKEQSATEN